MFTYEHTLEDSCSIAYDDYNNEYNIFSSPTIEEKTRYDYNMPPIFDDYGDENNYFGEGDRSPALRQRTKTATQSQDGGGRPPSQLLGQRHPRYYRHPGDRPVLATLAQA
jgi:hypothetical protein